VDLTCCWTKEQIEQGDCPYIREDEEELRNLLSRRVVEKCFYCDRFREDLRLLTEEDRPLSRLVPFLIEAMRDQKNQISAMAGSLDSRNQQISFLHELAEVLQTTMNLDEVLSVAMTAITAGKGFGMNRAFLLLTDKCQHNLGIGPRNLQEAWQTWDEISHHNYSLTEMASQFFSTKLRAEKEKFNWILNQLGDLLTKEGHILNRVLSDHKPLLVDERVRTDEGDDGLSALLEVDSYLIMPLVCRNRPVGVILADNYVTHKVITRQNMESLETFGYTVAFAIERASLYDQLQEKVERLVDVNEQLLEQQEQIVRMEKLALVGEITSSIAHSIRNPLVTIGGFARNLLKNSADDDPLREQLQALSSAAQQLDDVLTEVLTSSDSLYPARDQWDVNLLVYRVSEELTERLALRGLVVRLDLAQNLPMAFIDFRQITFCFRTIIINLLDSLADGSTVTVFTRQMSDGILLEASAGPVPVGHTTTGLGIMVCRNLLEKQGIPFTITTIDQEISFRITVPIERRD
jgi:GAF domain-containing protein